MENDLRGNENWFELSRVRVTEGKITVNVGRKTSGNRLWFELARGSSYRESTVVALYQLIPILGMTQKE